MVQLPDSLLTIAELALGLAGFSGVILVFSGLPETMHPMDSARIRLLLSMSLGAMVLAILPFGMQLLTLGDGSIWRVACGALVTYGLLLATVLLRDLRSMPRASRLQLFGGSARGSRSWAIAVALVSLGVFLAEAMHAAGWLSGWGRAVFFWGLLWLVAMAAYLFASLVFDRPVPQ